MSGPLRAPVVEAQCSGQHERCECAVGLELGEGTLSGGGTSHSITNGGSGDYIGADIQTISPNSRRGNGFLYLDFDATPNLNFYFQGLAGLSNGPFNVFVQARYIGPGIYNVRFNLPTAARPDIDDNTIGSMVYTDLTLGYRWETAGGELELTGNALNLFDRAPPVVASWDGALAQTSNQVNAGLFDPLGRRYTIGVNFRY